MIKLFVCKGTTIPSNGLFYLVQLFFLFRPNCFQTLLPYTNKRGNTLVLDAAPSVPMRSINVHYEISIAFWDLTNFFPKRWKGQLCQPEVHLSEWDANDGDAEYEAVEDVGEPYPDAANEEPQHIHEDAQTAWLRWFPFYFRTKRPDGQHTQFHALQAEGDADDGYHQYQACDEILQGYVQASENDDVS